MNTAKLIILDRDGVINHDSDDYIKSPQEWLPIEGSAEAIGRLNSANYVVGVATNQSGIARGMFDVQTLEAIHLKMANYLAEFGAHIDHLVYCPDHPNKPGPNRKPAPGMANTLLTTTGANAAETWFVGDSLSDIQCALNAGCRPALVKTGKGLKTLKNPDFQALNVPVFESLADFVNNLL